jgi:uncharacterized protein YaaR (DUF327 family)
MKKKVALILLVLFSLSSCATFQSWFKPVAHYDQVSYQNLTGLKAELNAFIDHLKPDTPQDKIDAFYLMYDKIYEYEKGKGLENTETSQQLSLLKGRIDVFVKEAQASDLTQVYRDSKKETLDRILDVIISTENARPH